MLIDESYTKFGPIQVIQMKGNMATDEPHRHRIYVAQSGSPDRELLDEILTERENLKEKVKKLELNLQNARNELSNYYSFHPPHKHKFLFWRI